MRISDWSSDVCSSDLRARGRGTRLLRLRQGRILHERRQEIIGPADHIGVADDGIELFPSRLALGERHVHRGPARARDLSALVRVTEQQIGRETGRERACQYVYSSVVPD